ncbi:MAG: aminoglycoside phosphotransferase family protein [Candidatus Paceibacterota bacterium]
MSEDLRGDIEKIIKEKITKFELKASGFVNNAYYLETKTGKKCIVKVEKEIQEFTPQNSLVIEAKVAQKLYESNLTIPVPEVIFVSQDPDMYGYSFIEGDTLRNVWKDLSEEERIDILRNLGYFHAQIGKIISKQNANEMGVLVDDSTGLHLEVLADYHLIISDESLPKNMIDLAQKAKSIFDTTLDQSVFQFIHNDAHHENVLIKDKKISGFIDFGNSEYGETAREFSRYIRDFPNHFQHIIDSYEEESNNKLSLARLITNSFLSGLIDNVEDYKKGGKDRVNAEKSFDAYGKMIESL